MEDKKMEKFFFKSLENQENTRLDKFLAEEFAKIRPDITRSKVQKAIVSGLVTDSKGNVINNISRKITIDEEFIVTIQETATHEIKAKKIDFEIVFEDDDLLVINKPAGLTVHPGAGNHDNTLVNALLYSHRGNLSSGGDKFRPGIVHRLDKDTSGLMLVAKNDETHYALSKNLQERLIKRSYLAFIFGVMDPKSGKIDKNITRSRFNRLKMRTVAQSLGVKSRHAVTNYQTCEIFLDDFASLVECQLETGRTHQIRVHFESERHSLIGDQVYNSCRKNPPSESSNLAMNFGRQALHSYKIEFLHPRNGEDMSFEIDLPKDLLELYEELRRP